MICLNCGCADFSHLGECGRGFGGSALYPLDEFPENDSPAVNSKGSCADDNPRRSFEDVAPRRSFQLSDVQAVFRNCTDTGIQTEVTELIARKQHSVTFECYLPLQDPTVSNDTVTVTIEVRTDGATTLSRVNLSGYEGRVTIFSRMFTTAFCLAVELRLKVKA